MPAGSYYHIFDGDYGFATFRDENHQFISVTDMNRTDSGSMQIIVFFSII